MRCFRALAGALVALVSMCGLTPESARGGEFYVDVNIDTSSLNGLSGYLDLQFNPDLSTVFMGPGNSTPSLTATVALLATAENGLQANTMAFGGQTGPFGNESGSLSGAPPVVLTSYNDSNYMNYSAFNEDTEAITFGHTLGLHLVFDTTDSVSAALFELTLLLPPTSSAPYGIPVYSNLSGYNALDIDVQGSSATLPFDLGPGVSDFSPSITPEPNSGILLGTATVILGGAWWNRRRGLQRV